jgi:hypothetical protein
VCQSARMFTLYLYGLTCLFFLPYILFIIGIQPLGRFGQRPELSQPTGIAVVRCILGKFLGVGCHYFPPSYIYLLEMKLLDIYIN